MKLKKIGSIIIFIFSTMLVWSQDRTLPKDFCISEKANKLFELINEARTEKRLDQLPLSASLSFVAHTHINDLIQNRPDTSLCNLHSWSDKGFWTSCCYQAYIPVQECMWNKPQEISPYKYRGYELAFWQSEDLTAEEILAGWMNIPQASDMILNKGEWQNVWRTMGIATKDGYAVVWFGRAIDSEPKPTICGEVREIKSENKSVISERKSVVSEKTNQYYLIFGSFNRLKDAEKRIEKLKKDGFNDAVILNTDEKYRIALSSYPDIESAKMAKSGLDKKYDEAWILKF
ncbi:MAG: hypothetical protein CVU00_04755 [Bacteroidetes bacterium HGW-Bacteroidetes-17]|jgi:hypothetical protein|nr:MAG: hypothetical protein CVU00_04755 [Bacteroidetes bacterium HGW-Bacteroidetes-17]